MGSCVSHHKEPQSAAELRLSVETKNENLLIHSPVKQKPITVNGVDHSVPGFAVKSRFSPPRFRDDGSKDEAFFDSQPWLESDGEDDFLSINGDFTPSRGSTPVHHNFSSGNPKANKEAPLSGGPLGSPPEPSPKKRLSELFQESLRRDHVDDDDEASNQSVVLENVATKPNGVHREDQELEKSAQCCLPRLRSSRSFSEKKKKMSPLS